MKIMIENREKRKSVQLMILSGILALTAASVEVKQKKVSKEFVKRYETSKTKPKEILETPMKFSKFDQNMYEAELEKAKNQIEIKKRELEQNIITINGYKYRIKPGELELLKRVVYAESRGESIEEQIATTETILNRVAFYKNTIDEVLHAKGQFQCVKSDGNVYTGMEPNLVLVTDERVSKKVSDAVETAVYGEDDITESLLKAEAIRQGLDIKVYAEGGALYFYEPNPNIVSKSELDSRKNIKVKVKIGEGEHFYYKKWDK